jgi:hypothetical protein
MLCDLIIRKIEVSNDIVMKISDETWYIIIMNRKKSVQSGSSKCRLFRVIYCFIIGSFFEIPVLKKLMILCIYF